MGYSIDRALRQRALAKTAIGDAMRMVEFYGMTHGEELAKIETAMRHVKGAPRWVHAYLSGWRECASDARYSSGKLIYAHIAPDGTLYTGHKGAPDPFKSSAPLYAAGRGGEMSGWPSGHFWMHNAKPYFSGRDMDRCTTDAQRAAMGALAKVEA